jgi:uroporphyrinogen decarboxylase
LEPLVRAGINIIWHCDGDVTPIIDRMLAMGVAGFQGFQEDAGVRLDKLVRARTIKGRRPILLGSVQARSVLPFGTVDDVKQEVERCINVVGRESGFVLGPSAVIQPEIPIENIRAMYDHAKEYGRIPITPWGVKL